MADQRIPAVLSIAGSDSGGGAGIQADLKAFARCGVHGMTAITALTAQNTVEVTAVESVSPKMIVEQVRAVATDIGVDAVKIGMLGDVATIEAVDEALDLLGDAPVVLDPVMVSESGATLLEPDAIATLTERLLPRATVVTPNIAEARRLTESGPEATQEELATAVHALGPRAVIVTGGHTKDGIDLLYEGEGDPWRIGGRRYPDGAAHGSGCTHSSAVAAFLALGAGIRDAATNARALTSAAVGAGLREIGSGAGPVDAFGEPSRS